MKSWLSPPLTTPVVCEVFVFVQFLCLCSFVLEHFVFVQFVFVQSLCLCSLCLCSLCFCSFCVYAVFVEGDMILIDFFFFALLS